MITVWHHEACRVMTNGDSEAQIFYPTLTRMMDSYKINLHRTEIKERTNSSHLDILK